MRENPDEKPRMSAVSIREARDKGAEFIINARKRKPEQPAAEDAEAPITAKQPRGKESSMCPGGRSETGNQSIETQWLPGKPSIVKPEVKTLGDALYIFTTYLNGEV